MFVQENDHRGCDRMVAKWLWEELEDAAKVYESIPIWLRPVVTRPSVEKPMER